MTVDEIPGALAKFLGLAHYTPHVSATIAPKPSVRVMFPGIPAREWDAVASVLETMTSWDIVVQCNYFTYEQWLYGDIPAHDIILVSRDLAVTIPMSCPWAQGPAPTQEPTP